MGKLLLLVLCFLCFSLQIWFWARQMLGLIQNGCSCEAVWLRPGLSLNILTRDWFSCVDYPESVSAPLLSVRCIPGTGETGSSGGNSKGKNWGIQVVLSTYILWLREGGQLVPCPYRFFYPVMTGFCFYSLVAFHWWQVWPLFLCPCRPECQALGLTVLVDARRCSPVPALFKAFSILQVRLELGQRNTSWLAVLVGCYISICCLCLHLPPGFPLALGGGVMHPALF